MAVDKQRRVICITGATEGIGRQVAEDLAEAGDTVVLAARNLDKAHKVATEIRAVTPTASLIVGPRLDLLDLESIRSFAAGYKALGLPLHVLINNAGAFIDWQGEDEGQITAQCQIGYLGPYALTRMLEPVLIASAPSRVVNVSSILHHYAEFDSLNAKKFFSTILFSRYHDAKLAGLFFTYELQRRLGAHGVETCAVDPGGVRSGVWDSKVGHDFPMNLIQKLYAPPSSGSSAVIHAVNFDFKSAPSGEADKQAASSNADRSQCRYFARGAGASWLLDWRDDGKGAHALDGSERRGWWALLSLILSALEWPIRLLTGGLIWDRVHLAKSSPKSYDEGLAKEFWSASAKLTSLPSNTMFPTKEEISKIRGDSE